MKLPPFAVHRPGSVTQASRLLIELGDDAAVYCGGTELLLAMKLGLASYEHLVDLKRVPGLRGITADRGILRIAAATTHHQLETSAALSVSYPELAAMISQVANLRVRSTGTLGGNLCFADPHSDPSSFLIAVGATMVCQRADATRSIPAAEFCTGPYETALRPGELLVAVELPPRPPRAGIAHLRMKLTERPVVTVTAQVSLGDTLAVCDASLVVGSVGGVPFRSAAAPLIGAGPGDFERSARSCAEQAADGCPVLTEGECSPEYLRQLVRVYARDALLQAFAAAASRFSPGRPS